MANNSDFTMGVDKDRELQERMVGNATRIITASQGDKVVSAMWRMNTPYIGERENVARVLAKHRQIPKSIINYMVSKGNPDAIEKSIIMLGDLLDPDYKRVRPSLAKDYENIKKKYRVRVSVKARTLKPEPKPKKDIVEKHLAEKRGVHFAKEVPKKKEIDIEMSAPAGGAQFSYSFSAEALKKFEQAFNSAMNDAEINPEGMNEEKIEETGKELMSCDLGVNVDVYKDILRNIRDSALEFSTSQKACNEVADCAHELKLTDPNDVNGIAAALVRLLTAARTNASKLVEERNSLANNNQKLSMEVAQLNARASKAESDVTDLNTEISTKNTQLATIVGQMSTLQKQYDSIQTQLKKSQKTITEKDEEYLGRINKKNEEALVLQQQYNDLNVEKLKLERELANHNIELGEKEAEVVKMRSQLEVYERTNKSLAAVDLEKASKITSLNNEIGKLNTTIGELNQKLTFKEDEYKRIADVKDKEIQDLQEVKEKWLAQKAEMDQLASKNGELEAQVDSLENQKKALEESLKEKDKANAVLREKGIASAETQEQLNREHLNAKAVIKDLNNQIGELKEQIKLNNAKTVDFQAKYESTNAKLQTAEKELSNAKQINNTMKSEYDEANRTIGSLQAKMKSLETQLSSEAKLRVEAQEECEKAMIRCSKAKAESIKLKVAKDKALAETVKLQSDLEALQKLKESTFVVAQPTQDEQGDVVMNGPDAQGEIASVLVAQQEELPIPLPKVTEILAHVARPKKRSTAPAKQPPTLAGKKRSLNKVGGAYLVGGRPDPDLSRGSKFWKNAYNKGFKLF